MGKHPAQCLVLGRGSPSVSHASSLLPSSRVNTPVLELEHQKGGEEREHWRQTWVNIQRERDSYVGEEGKGGAGTGERASTHRYRRLSPLMTPNPTHSLL